MIDPRLLEVLCCPETRQTLSLADSALIQNLNERIEAGKLQNRAGKKIENRLDGGLIREDRTALYPIRNRLPIMLIEESIPL